MERNSANLLKAIEWFRERIGVDICLYADDEYIEYMKNVIQLNETSAYYSFKGDIEGNTFYCYSFDPKNSPSAKFGNKPIKGCYGDKCPVHKNFIDVIRCMPYTEKNFFIQSYEYLKLFREMNQH